MEPKRNSKPLCSMCKLEEFKYTCPRCNIQYCSMTCYKAPGHSACSESFYRDWFVQEMKERKVSPHEQERVLSMLQKVEEENPLDIGVDQTLTLEERMQGLNLNTLKEKDTEKLWDALTLKEREEFKAAVQKGEICDSSGCSLTEPWKPWWTTTKTLIQDVNNPIGIHNNCPNTVKVPELSSLLPKGKDPSPLIAFNLVNTLYPYALFQRIFNGCGTSDFIEDLCSCCIKSSPYLDHNQTFLNAQEAIISAMRFSADVCQKEDISVSETTLTEAIKDVGLILTGPAEDKMFEFVCSALSDLHCACNTHRRSLKKHSLKSKYHEGHISTKQLFSVIKKLEFLISWTLQQNACLPLLAIEVLEIYKQKKTELNAHLKLRQTIVQKPVAPKKKIITEMS